MLIYLMMLRLSLMYWEFVGAYKISILWLSVIYVYATKLRLLMSSQIQHLELLPLSLHCAIRIPKSQFLLWY